MAPITTLPHPLLIRAIVGLAVVRDRLVEPDRPDYSVRQRALFAVLRMAMVKEASAVGKMLDHEARDEADRQRNRILGEAGALAGPEPACRCGSKHDLIFGKQTEWMTLCRPCERIWNN